MKIHGDLDVGSLTSWKENAMPHGQRDAPCEEVPMYRVRVHWGETPDMLPRKVVKTASAYHIGRRERDADDT